MRDMTHNNATLPDVITFWFEELSFADKFSGKPEIDAAIKERFGATHAAVAAGEFGLAARDAKQYLAEIIVLDQFSRQLFRDTPQAFAYDGQALTLAQECINRGLDTELEPGERMFLYMPFMHSESRVIHAAAVPLFASLKMDEPLKYEHIHKDIIDRFGRYPHRNDTLGRQSTPEEVEYLANNHEDFF